MRQGDTVHVTRRRTWKIGAAAGLSVPLAGLLALPAAAAVPGEGASSGTTTARTATDAWYSASAACTSGPTGCLPAGAPTSPYPAKTLHVGVLAGQEEARAYLSLDLAGLPAGTALTGGTLQLPIAGIEDGSRGSDAATVQACLVTASFKDDVEGSTEAPPKTDCKKATSTATYVAAAGSKPEMLTVDLAPFAAAWSSGALQQGIALLPAADTSPGSAWHVAFSAHDRAGSSVPAPTAQVAYASSAAAGDSFDEPTFAAPAAATNSSSASFAAPALAPTSESLPAAPLPAAQPEVAPQTPPVAPAQQLTPQAFVGGGGFAYPGVFLVPVLLAGAAGWLGRALTRDLTDR